MIPIGEVRAITGARIIPKAPRALINDWMAGMIGKAFGVQSHHVDHAA